MDSLGYFEIEWPECWSDIDISVKDVVMTRENCDWESMCAYTLIIWPLILFFVLRLQNQNPLL